MNTQEMEIEFYQHRKRMDLKNLDRISSLPEGLILEILSRLPIREALTTSTLSRKWRHIWTFMPKLVFDAHSQVQERINTNLVDFVNKILLRHSGGITTFLVYDYLDFDIVSSDVDLWILALSRKPLRSLTLGFKTGTSYKMHSSLFSFQHLKALNLKECELCSPPQEFKGFSNLASLGLSFVRVSKETIDILVNNSPLLEQLGIVGCALSHLKICAPNLRILVLQEVCQGITFINTPKLKQLFIGSITCGPDEIFGTQELRYVDPFSKFSSMDASHQKLPSLELVRMEINFADRKQILASLCLIRNSPSLKRVHIIACGQVQPNLSFGEGFWEEQLRQNEVILQSLEVVHFRGFRGRQHELGFIKFLLLRATVLQTMRISWNKSVQMMAIEKVHLLEQLLHFRRSSSHAEIVFKDQV